MNNETPEEGASGAVKPGALVTVLVKATVVFVRPHQPGDRTSHETGGMVKVRIELFASRGYVEGQYIETWVPRRDLQGFGIKETAEMIE